LALVAMIFLPAHGAYAPQSRQQQTYPKPGTSTWPGFFVVRPAVSTHPDHDQHENRYD